jgi:hypothetical protein
MLAWNPSGYGPWNQELAFTTEVPDPAASTPHPVGPSGSLSSLSPTYTWERVADAVLYRLSISSTGNPLTDSWFTPSALNCVSEAAQCAITRNVASNGDAQWKVQAWTAIGYGSWSNTMSVSFGVFPAPQTPNPLSPDGTSGASPTLTWTSSDHVVYYYVRVDDVNGNRVDRWLTPTQVGCANGGTCTFSPSVLLNAGPASWRLLAWNPSGYSSWSNPVTFTVQ